MKDAEATAVVMAFKSMLSGNDKTAVKKAAEGLLTDEFMGMSTGANSMNDDDASPFPYLFYMLKIIILPHLNHSFGA